MRRTILFLGLLILLSSFGWGTLSDSLLSCYSLNSADRNATHYYTSTGTNDVQMINSPLLDQNCKIGQCAGFNDATTDYLRSMDDAGVSGSSARTVCFWAYLNESGNNHYTGVSLGTESVGSAFHTYVKSTASATSGLYIVGYSNDHDSGSSPLVNDWQFICTSFDGASGANIRTTINGTATPTYKTARSLNTGVNKFYIGATGIPSSPFSGYLDEIALWSRNLTEAEITELYNSGTGRDCGYITGGGGAGSIPAFSAINCTVSNPPAGDSVAPYTTSDTTPTFALNTDVNANCRIGDENQNYTTLGATRDCAGGQASTTHTCTLTTQDELVASTDAVYVSCASTSNDDLTNTTELIMDITSLAGTVEDAIDLGIQTSTIWPGATIYTNQKVYMRNLNNNQLVATVDKVAVYGNQRWIINNALDGASLLGLFNITPAVYTLDVYNVSSTEMTSKVSALINSTKS